MIRINHTPDLQPFAVTCDELKTLESPFFLFVFTDDMTNETLAAVLPDLSAHKSRYNLFQISGTFFPSSGWYSYAVYEQAGIDNTDPALSGAIVEAGKLQVIPEAQAIYNEYKTTENFKEYAG